MLDQTHEDPNRKAETRTCVFCGTATVTREHVWPGWIGKELDRRHGTEEWTTVMPDRTFSQKQLAMCVKRVCKGCNDGWMSDLEQEAKPILLPMMLAESAEIELRPTAQQTLATWALKTALMASFYTNDPRRTFPPWIYPRFFKERRPPDGNAVVWTGAYNGRIIQLQSRVGTVDLEATHSYNTDGILVPGKTTHRAALATLRVIFSIFQVLVYPGYSAPMGNEGDGVLVHRIWPPHKRSVFWPPNKTALNDDGVTRLMHRHGKLQDLKPL